MKRLLFALIFSTFPIIAVAQVTGNTINGQSQVLIPRGGNVNGTFHNSCVNSGCRAIDPITLERFSAGTFQIAIIGWYHGGAPMFPNWADLRKHGNIREDVLYYIIPGVGRGTNTYEEVLELTNWFLRNIDWPQVDGRTLLKFNAELGNQLDNEFERNSVVYLPLIKTR